MTLVDTYRRYLRKATKPWRVNGTATCIWCKQLLQSGTDGLYTSSYGDPAWEGYYHKPCHLLLSRRIRNFHDYAVEAGYIDAEGRVVARPAEGELTLVRDYIDFLA